MALVSRARGSFYGRRAGGAPHRRAVFIGFGPLAGGAAGARERSLKSSHFVAPLFGMLLCLPATVAECHRAAHIKIANGAATHGRSLIGRLQTGSISQATRSVASTSTSLRIRRAG